MSKGGKRKGAGGYQGQVKPKFTDYFSQDDIADYFAWVKKNYKKKGNQKLATWVGDHLCGKPVQPLEGDLGGGQLVVKFDNAFTTRKTKDNS